MSYGMWSLVIFLTFAVGMLGIWVLLERGNAELERIRLLGQLEEGMGRVQLPRAGLLPLDHLPETGPSGPWLEPEPFDLCNALLREGHMPGRLFELSGSYGPFPVDTGPLLHLSEQAAARIALERDIEAMCAEAEAKIPPRWR